MLVLTRKLNQVIRINDNVIIQIVDVDGRNVKLGIDAPKDVSVHREEIYQRIKIAENVDGENYAESYAEKANDLINNLESKSEKKNPIEAA